MNARTSLLAVAAFVVALTIGIWALTDLTSALLLFPVFAVLGAVAWMLTEITLIRRGDRDE